jgi:hypothetical protein
MFLFSKALGLTHSQFDDNFMYFKIDLDGNMLIILLYVDDLLLVGHHKDDVERIKCIALMESFEMAGFEMTNLARVKLLPMTSLTTG